MQFNMMKYFNSLFEFKKAKPYNIVLKGLRGREGLTQAQLAAKLSISIYQLQKWEHGKEAISEYWAVQLAEALNTNKDMFNDG